IQTWPEILLLPTTLQMAVACSRLCSMDLFNQHLALYSMRRIAVVTQFSMLGTLIIALLMVAYVLLHLTANPIL
ncbi:MAG: hypothetical protein ACK56I_01700, partial [bacterium]